MLQPCFNHPFLDCLSLFDIVCSLKTIPIANVTAGMAVLPGGPSRPGPRKAIPGHKVHRQPLILRKGAASNAQGWPSSVMATPPSQPGNHLPSNSMRSDASVSHQINKVGI